MLFQMLTNQLPFQGATQAELLHQILHKDPVSPQQLAQPVDPALMAICRKALRKSPFARYQSAGDLGRALRRWQRGEGRGAVRIGLFADASSPFPYPVYVYILRDELAGAHAP